ncbi:hypothetical protein M569_07117 [Genlisea aurea]|uniref:Late embryogenesis abundant protein LEA-2 subgroup domain-containing protein n=1 Tax=Genlisea aurea TaxID=192259 RepID=S8CLN7_9LAMI|nr:hypothetical protein M569_07117 [Genlisea aurea]
MADSSRPATGYPAPNPPPTNGYSANQPPLGGGSYPYGRPPPSGGYYGYQSYPQSYQYDPNYAQRLTFLRRIVGLGIAVLIVFGTITFIVWLVLRPQMPQFQVDSLSISNFSLGSSSLISFTSAVRLTATNPNKKMKLEYDDIQAYIYYKTESLSQTSVPPFQQETRNITSLTANFAAAGSFVDGFVVNGINGERANSGDVNFNFRMITRVAFEAKAWRARRRYLKVICADLIVGIPNNVSSGALTATLPKPCQVGV